jgi:multisubunit Na+/H+ antiporter MnhB subunit
MKKHVVTFLFFVLFGILVYGILQMPTDPSVNAPSYNDATQYYFDNALSETGATNIVAAILADYRAFDTLGETIVLFTSIVAAASVLRSVKKKDEVGGKSDGR